MPRILVPSDLANISASREPLHLSHFIINLIDSDYHTEDWTFTLAGCIQLHAHFELKRTNDGKQVAKLTRLAQG
jgi:hypothetical protein